MSHIHDLIDFTVEVFVVHSSKVLLRKHDKYKIWLSVGGHIELNEDPNQAALREVKEEVGLDIQLFDPQKQSGQVGEYKIIIPPRFMNRHHISDTHEHVTFVYFAICQDDKVTQTIEAEKTDCQWLSAEEVEDLSDITDLVRSYALTALNEVRG